MKQETKDFVAGCEYTRKRYGEDLAYQIHKLQELTKKYEQVSNEKFMLFQEILKESEHAKLMLRAIYNDSRALSEILDNIKKTKK